MRSEGSSSRPCLLWVAYQTRHNACFDDDHGIQIGNDRGQKKILDEGDKIIQLGQHIT